MERIEALTAELLAAAEADDWEQAFGIEAERRPLIETFFANLSQNRRQSLRPRVEALMAADQRVMALGKACQAAIGEALGKLSQGKTAIKAYEAQT